MGAEVRHERAARYCTHRAARSPYAAGLCQQAGVFAVAGMCGVPVQEDWSYSTPATFR
jgi:hypothetical protein